MSKKWQNFLEVKTNNNNDSQNNELLFNKSQLKKNRSIFSYSSITNHILFKLSSHPLRAINEYVLADAKQDTNFEH